ncbi:hypothetical protein BLNAU_3014 [Blattamonas nauphoetae]|uniref:Uncharacterized protein n=1 Tax=Blattamonas nauphoetae TaxID=2049346 RepID=A0ABQ9YE45_9EUKA|nr:hypothetical protein BLNAU_3014 [Blattamonas nauphoetae]
MSAFLSRNENSKTGIGKNAISRYFGGSLATLTASSMVVSDCTLYLDGTTSPFILKPSSLDSAPSTVELVHSKIVASIAVMGPVSEIESSDTPCQFDIVIFSTDLASICVVDGNSLSFRHSDNRNDDKISLSTVSSSLISNSFTNVTSASNHHSLEISALSQRCVGSSITQSVGALQGTVVSDFNSGGSLLCSNTTFAKCTTAPTVYKDILIHRTVNMFFSKYSQSYRPEFRFEDTDFSAQKQFNEFVRDPDDGYFRGGLAILIQTPAPVTITSCTFSDLPNDANGAAIYSETAYTELTPTLFIEKSTFTRCSSYLGGAVYLDSSGRHSIVSSIFTNNSCSSSGGACISYDCDVHPPETLLGCSRSEDDWEGDSEVVVMENGKGEECSASQPCSELSKGLSKASMNGKRTIHVGSGWTGSATIVESVGPLTLRSFCQLDEESRNPQSPISSFSITVGQDSNITLDSLSLSPANSLPLLKCESSGGSVEVVNVQIANIEGISAPLFVFSSGSLTMKRSRFENLSLVTGNLFSISGSADVSIEVVLFRKIDTSSSLFIASSGGSLLLSQCLFYTITRTLGEGAAVIDVNECDSFRIASSTFSHCHSKEGLAGALCLTLTDSSIFEPAAFFLNNTGKTKTSAHDIFISGISPSQQNPYFYVSVNSFSAYPQVIDGSNPHPDILPAINGRVMKEHTLSSMETQNQQHIFARDLNSIDIQQVLTSQHRLTLEIVDTTTIPIVLPYLQLVSSFLTIKTPQSSFLQHIQKTPESEGSFFVATNSANINFASLYFIVSSTETMPHITVDSMSCVTLSECLFTSDGFVINYPIVRSSGTVNLIDSNFADITFDGHSCIECDAGNLLQNHKSSQTFTSAFNLTTSGDGAFLNAQNCHITFMSYSFFDCHAAKGGAVFCRDCSSVIFYQPIAFRCSADQNGGFLCIDSPTTPIGIGLYLCISDCSAELGGGVFINVTHPQSFSLYMQPSTTIFGVRHSRPLFSNCSASKGAGAYFDGDWSGVNSVSCSSLFLSNGGLPSTGQDFFISASVAETMPDFETSFISTLSVSGFSLSSRSTSDTGPYKHVEIEGGSVPSFNFKRPKFVLQSSTFDDYCQIWIEAKCASITRLLNLFHTKDEDGEFVQIPISLNSEVYFFETGVVRSQSVLLKTDIINDPLDEIKLSFGTTYWKDDSFFVRVEKNGTAELSSIAFVWGADIGFCEVADESGKMSITSSTFDVKINLTHSLAVCSAGTLIVTQSTFTSTDSQVAINCPLVASYPLFSLFSNGATESLKVEMDTVAFSNLKVDGNVDGVVHFEGADTLHLKKVSFASVLCGSEEAVRIVVVGWDLGRVIEYDAESDFPKRGTGFDALYKSLDLSAPLSNVYRTATLLLYFHRTTAETISESSEGRDGIWCGDSTFHCLSLNEADVHLQPAYPSRIVVGMGAVLNSELDLTQDLTEIKAMGGEKSRVDVLRDGSLVNQADTLTHSLTLDMLVFSLSAGRTTSLLVSRGGKLILTSCSFILSDLSPLTSKLVEVSGGTVELNKVDLGDSL